MIEPFVRGDDAAIWRSRRLRSRPLDPARNHCDPHHGALCHSMDGAAWIDRSPLQTAASASGAAIRPA